MKKSVSDVASGTIKGSAVQAGEPPLVEAATGEQTAAARGNEKETRSSAQQSAPLRQKEGRVAEEEIYRN